MPDIIIDGKKVTFTGKANIIEMARSVGVEIPAFCYHPALSVSGNCRMCMVEVGMPAKDKSGAIQKDEKGDTVISFMPKLQPACYQEPVDGMVIKTDSEKVIETRKRILEFLLINHPLDCPVCDQAGECVLQDYSFQYGFTQSRFLETKRTYEKTFFSDVITPELNRCIHCDRCSRFTKEIANDFSFTRTWRGNGTELAALPDMKIEHNYQGNMVDICPVGALTLTDFRFKSRVWFLKNSEGICTSCGKGCNVVYAIDRNNKILRIKPRFNKNINNYWMCDFGRLRYSVFNEKRLTKFLIQGKETSIESAVEHVQKQIVSNSRVGIIASAAESLEGCNALADLAKNFIKSEHIDYRVHSAQMKEDTSLKNGEVLMVNDPYPNSMGAKKAHLLPGPNGLSAEMILKNPEQLDILLVVIDDKLLENQVVVNALKKAGKVILFSPWDLEWFGEVEAVLPLQVSLEQRGTFININGVEQKFEIVKSSEKNSRSMIEYVSMIMQAATAVK